MRFFCILLFFIYSSFSAQNSEVSTINKVITYTLKYLPDSTVTNYHLEENFILQINSKNESCFISENNLRARQAFSSTPSFSMSLGGIPRTKFLYAIYNFEDTLHYYENVFFNKISYEENLKLDWRIIEEKKKIGDYWCYKATTQYGGRDWEAWFSPDIPIFKGPYKFSGLPGLIVEIYDSRKHYNFALLNVSVVNTPEKLFDINAYKNYVKITRAEYFKIRKQALDNFAFQSQVVANPDERRYLQQQVARRNNNSLELME